MTSDLPIPPIARILDRAHECRASAMRLSDEPTIRQIDRLIEKLPGAALCWILGTLHITSPSGGSYRVTRAGCDCLNAQRCGKRACWHVALFGILEDLFMTDCDTADMSCDPPIDIPEEPPPPTPGGPPPPERRHIGARIAAARLGFVYC